MKTKLLTIISISLLFTGLSFGAPKKGTMKDSRDGKTYKTEKIGRQVWMAENLNYEIDGSDCYENDPANCEKYGRLYTWEAALNACPEGWHLPTEEEFGTLISNVGGKETAGKMLKSTIGWSGYKGVSGNGIDKYGFNVLPAGERTYNGGFINAGYCAKFWSATELSEDAASSWRLLYDHTDVRRNSDLIKYLAYSVRCLRD